MSKAAPTLFAESWGGQRPLVSVAGSEGVTVSQVFTPLTVPRPAAAYPSQDGPATR